MEHVFSRITGRDLFLPDIGIPPALQFMYSCIKRYIPRDKPPKVCEIFKSIFFVFCESRTRAHRKYLFMVYYGSQTKVYPPNLEKIWKIVERLKKSIQTNATSPPIGNFHI